MPTLSDPVSIPCGPDATLVLRNRLYRAPVLEGAGSHPRPHEVYARHFVPNARAGVGLIVQGNTIVTPQGRTSPGMCRVATREDVLGLAPMVAQVQAAGARIVLQLGHGGSFSLGAWQQQAQRAGEDTPWAPSRLPAPLRWAHPGARPLSTGEVEALVMRFGQVAAWAQEAGYDGVQLAASNAKLLHQFLSPFYNRRQDRYGGSTAGRFQLLADIRREIVARCGPNYPVLLKMTVKEHLPFWADLPQTPRLDLAEGIALARLAEREGFVALTPAEANVLPNASISRGASAAAALDQPNVARRLLEAAGSPWRVRLMAMDMDRTARAFPFRPTWNLEVIRAVRAQTRLPIFAVGGFRTRGQCDAVLGAHDADVIGIGRPFYAEPDLPTRLLAAKTPTTRVRCEDCNRCIVPQMLGLPGACYNPSIHRQGRGASL